jgi:hypothetical protein
MAILSTWGEPAVSFARQAGEKTLTKMDNLMNNIPTPFQSVLGIQCVAISICWLQLFAHAAVPLFPGSNIQRAVSAAPEGTVFTLAAGTYRMQSIKPKNGDVFQGLCGVIFSGAQILTFQPIGDLGTQMPSSTISNMTNARSRTRSAWTIRTCLSTASTNCLHPARWKLQSGSWYFDHLYLFSVLIPPQERYLPRFSSAVICEYGIAG